MYDIENKIKLLSLEETKKVHGGKFPDTEKPGEGFDCTGCNVPNCPYRDSGSCPLA